MVGGLSEVYVPTLRPAVDVARRSIRMSDGLQVGGALCYDSIGPTELGLRDAVSGGANGVQRVVDYDAITACQ